MVFTAEYGGVAPALAIGEVVEQAGVPCSTRRDFDRKAQAAIGQGHRRAGILRGDSEGTGEIFIAIAGGHGLSVCLPLGEDFATFGDLLALHLEQVGEVALEGECKLEPHGCGVVIGDVDILMHAAIDMPAEHQPQRLGGNTAPSLGRSGLVR